MEVAGEWEIIEARIRFNVPFGVLERIWKRVAEV